MFSFWEVGLFHLFDSKTKHGKTLNSAAAHVLLVFILLFALCAGDSLDFEKLKGRS